ncbi:MAG: hypothetical protein GY810_09890 [Aureispira sp.]|nr:hypothetical protein [Aureispira sp.]
MSTKYIFWIMALGLFSCSDSPSTSATENIETNEVKVEAEPLKNKRCIRCLSNIMGGFEL